MRFKRELYIVVNTFTFSLIFPGNEHLTTIDMLYIYINKYQILNKPIYKFKAESLISG